MKKRQLTLTTTQVCPESTTLVEYRPAGKKVAFVSYEGRVLVCAKHLRDISGISFSAPYCLDKGIWCHKFLGLQSGKALLFVDAQDLGIKEKKLSDGDRKKLLQWAIEIASTLFQPTTPKITVTVDVTDEVLKSLRKQQIYLRRLVLKEVNRSDELMNLVEKSNKVVHSIAKRYQELSDYIDTVLTPPEPESPAPLRYFPIGDYNKEYKVADEVDSLGKDGKERLVRKLGTKATALSKKLNVSIGSEPVGKFARDHFDYASPTRNTYREDVLKKVYQETFGPREVH